MRRRAFLFAIALAACRAAPPPTGRVGQRIEYQGFAVTVHSVEQADDFAGARKARAGYKLVALDVLVENNSSRRGAHWDPAHTRLIERTRKEDHKPRAQGREPVLGARLDMPQGESLRGWLTYEVPDGIRAMDFEYELPSAFDNVLLRFQLDK